MVLPWSRFPLHLMGEDSALWMLLLGILHHLWPSEAKGSTPNAVSNCAQHHPKNMFKNCNLCMESLSAVSLKDTVNHTIFSLLHHIANIWSSIKGVIYESAFSKQRCLRSLDRQTVDFSKVTFSIYIYITSLTSYVATTFCGKSKYFIAQIHLWSELAHHP